MQIRMQRLSGDPPYTLEVGRSATLADLRAEVCKQESCEVASFSLLLNEDILDHSKDHTSLLDCGIADNITLTLVRQVGFKIVTASLDKTAKIWDSSTGECKQTLAGHTDWVTSAAFSADESLVLTSS